MYTKHQNYRLSLYDNDILCSTVYVDFTDETVQAENYVDNPVKTAFGNNRCPDWSDFQAFLRERCIPEERAGLREYLEVLGLYEYDPMAIIQKTQPDGGGQPVGQGRGAFMSIHLVSDEKIAETSSKGNQEKWFKQKENRWYKLDQFG